MHIYSCFSPSHIVLVYQYLTLESWCLTQVYCCLKYCQFKSHLHVHPTFSENGILGAVSLSTKYTNLGADLPPKSFSDTVPWYFSITLSSHDYFSTWSICFPTSVSSIQVSHKSAFHGISYIISQESDRS